MLDQIYQMIEGKKGSGSTSCVAKRRKSSDEVIKFTEGDI